MKNVNYLNYFFVGVPTLLFIYGIFEEEFLIQGLIFSILTGVFQFVIGLKLSSDYSNDTNLKIYIVSVILYFIMWFIISLFDYKYNLHYLLFVIPVILTIYLSIIIYKKAQI